MEEGVATGTWKVERASPPVADKPLARPDSKRIPTLVIDEN
jgi:hypothetical protein